MDIKQPVYVAPDDSDDQLTTEELFGSEEVISLRDIEDLEDDDLCELKPGCAGPESFPNHHSGLLCCAHD
jgi:hypothetical protein